MLNNKQIVELAWKKEFVIPAFNIPYLPMVKPVIQAVRDENSFAFIQVARLEWEKFESKSLSAIYKEFKEWEDIEYVRLHLDHVPVVDEDDLIVEYIGIIKEAIDLGYQSLMIDGSRMSLSDNIRATKNVCNLAHKAGLPCEAELGAVLGHESGPMPPYDEIFESGRGFTRIDEATQFVGETECDWLSVAIGNIHGAISEATRGKKKPQAKLNIDHLKKLREATGIPIVLHGGSGIKKDYILEAVKNGVAKINIATEIRQPYEEGIEISVDVGRELVYEKTRKIIKDFLEITGTANVINQP